MEIPDELNALLAAMKLTGKEPAWKFSASTDQVTVQLTWTKAKELEGNLRALSSRRTLSSVRTTPGRHAIANTTSSQLKDRGKRCRIDYDEGFDLDDPELLRTPPPHTSPLLMPSPEAVTTALMILERPDTPYHTPRNKVKAKRSTESEPDNK
ncbi:unnamed protein product [Mytilus edulis]|uniref:Uncharacterized protein n=1 Tax=Mytilus edulis TaxID=6550 RepID=A0A8S3VK14_MYTED|nr:unnamed protein product [Mytilus edulis]